MKQKDATSNTNTDAQELLDVTVQGSQTASLNAVVAHIDMAREDIQSVQLVIESEEPVCDDLPVITAATGTVPRNSPTEEEPAADEDHEEDDTDTDDAPAESAEDVYGDLVCPYCGEDFETAGGLGSHKYFKHDRPEAEDAPVESADTNENDPTVCEVCGDEFDSQRGKNIHKARIHDSDQSDSDDTKLDDAIQEAGISDEGEPAGNDDTSGSDSDAGENSESEGENTEAENVTADLFEDLEASPDSETNGAGLGALGFEMAEAEEDDEPAPPTRLADAGFDAHERDDVDTPENAQQYREAVSVSDWEAEEVDLSTIYDITGAPVNLDTSRWYIVATLYRSNDRQQLGDLDALLQDTRWEVEYSSLSAFLSQLYDEGYVNRDEDRQFGLTALGHDLVYLQTLDADEYPLTMADKVTGLHPA